MPPTRAGIEALKARLSDQLRRAQGGISPFDEPREGIRLQNMRKANALRPRIAELESRLRDIYRTEKQARIAQSALTHSRYR